MNSIFKKEITVDFMAHGKLVAHALNALEWSEVLQAISTHQAAGEQALTSNVMIKASLRWIIRVDNVEFEDGEPFTIKDKELIPSYLLIELFNKVVEAAQPPTKKSDESVIILD